MDLPEGGYRSSEGFIQFELAALLEALQITYSEFCGAAYIDEFEKAADELDEQVREYERRA